MIHSGLPTLEQPQALRSRIYGVVPRTMSGHHRAWRAKELEELDEPRREVFTMAELAELTVPEIAEILEIPIDTAFSRLGAARQGFGEALVRHLARRERRGGR